MYDGHFAAYCMELGIVHLCNGVAFCEGKQHAVSHAFSCLEGLEVFSCVVGDGCCHAGAACFESIEELYFAVNFALGTVLVAV